MHRGYHRDGSQSVVGIWQMNLKDELSDKKDKPSSLLLSHWSLGAYNVNANEQGAVKPASIDHGVGKAGDISLS